MIEGVLFLCILVYSIIVLTDKPEFSEGMVLFYGDGCPHCENVEKYISDNGVKTKVSFEQKEVHKGNNMEEISYRAEQCGIPSSSLAIPLFWDGSKCYMGDKDIINYFKEKLDGKE